MGFEPLEDRRLLAARPFGALAQDTGEYMLGDVYVTVVLMESDGTEDASTENWTPTLIQQVKDKVQTGLNWWVDALKTNLGVPLSQTTDLLQFVTDFTHADNPVATGVEPISRESTDFTIWVNDFLTAVGVNTAANIETDMRAFNDVQRTTHGTDWAFTMFVVNDSNDPDDMFPPGGAGSFRQAFSFAGGLFMISPSSRPTSTFAHETGHMFWAKDEYPGGASFNDRRGYYDTQNTNAADNPAPGFVQQDSIMSSGAVLQRGYNQHISSQSSLEMIGWRDSDRDGIFDVVDVPHRLDGTGRMDAQTGNYRFVGSSAVQTLPNLNPSGLQNDITINRIHRAEYRIDGGTWQTAATFDAAVVSLDLQVPVAAGSHTVEIRTVDDRTGVISNIFQGTTDHPASTVLPGINGLVFEDSDGDGSWDLAEQALAGWTVHLVDDQGQTIELAQSLEPDDYAEGTVLNDVQPGVTVRATGSQVGDGAVSAMQCSSASTGSKTFHHRTGTAFAEGCTRVNWSANWTKNVQLGMDFSDPVTRVSLDAISNLSNQRGRLEIYDADDNLLGRYTTDALGPGQSETMVLGRATADIAYAIAYGHLNTTTAIRFDNLQFGPRAEAVTDAQGAYQLPYLEPGTYDVQVVPPSGWVVSSPASNRHTVTLAAGSAEAAINFGAAAVAAGWQNATNHFDVNADGFLSPIDALLVINDLNHGGARSLSPPSGNQQPPPYIDVDGDGVLAPVDALLLINELNRVTSQSQAAGERSVLAASDPTIVTPAAGVGEGEHVLTPVDPVLTLTPVATRGTSNAAGSVQRAPAARGAADVRGKLLVVPAAAEVAGGETHLAANWSGRSAAQLETLDEVLDLLAVDLTAHYEALSSTL